MPTVFVTQENHRLNYADAERYGEVVFLTAGEYSSMANSKHNQLIEDEIYRGIGIFNPTIDFLLLSGDPVISALAFHLAARISKERHHAADPNLTSKVSLLKWDSQTRRYHLITLTI